MTPLTCMSIFIVSYDTVTAVFDSKQNDIDVKKWTDNIILAQVKIFIFYFTMGEKYK